MKPKCGVEECDSPSSVRGYCTRHYRRVLRYGDPHKLKRSPRYATAAEAFDARTERDGDCLVWTGSQSSKGYGALNDKGRSHLVHRWAYERANGPIPKGMHIDHTCHNRLCVNVEHLRLATRFDNARNLIGARPESRTGIRGLRVVYGGSWEARVFTHGKHHRKQFPPDQKDAAIEWLIKTRKEMFGEFAGHPGHIKEGGKR